MCSSEGCSKEQGLGLGWGSVSGQQETPAFAGGAGGALLHQALHPRASPLCPLTQELEAFPFQGLLGRLLWLGSWPLSWGCWWRRQQQ